MLVKPLGRSATSAGEPRYAPHLIVRLPGPRNTQVVLGSPALQATMGPGGVQAAAQFCVLSAQTVGVKLAANLLMINNAECRTFGPLAVGCSIESR